MAVELGAAYISILPSTSKLAPALRRDLGKSMPAEGKRAGRSLSSAIGSAVKKTAAVGLAGAGVAAGAALVGGFKSALNQQKSEAILGGLYQSGTVAKKLMKDIATVSKTSVIDYGTYSKAAEALAYMGVSGKDAPKMLENIGDAIAGAGGGSAEMERASDALLGMVNAGQVQLDTLNQLSDTGVPIYSALAEQQGVSIKKLREMVTAGKIGIEDVQAAIQNASGKTYKKQIAAAKKAEQTLSGQWAIAKDNITRSIGQMIVPLLDKLAPAVGTIGKAITAGLGKLPGLFARLGQVGKGALAALSPALSSIGGSLTSLWGSAKSTIAPMRQIVAALMPLAKDVLKVAIGAIVVAFRALAEIGKRLASALGWVGDFAEKHPTAFRRMAVAVLAAVGAYKALSLAFRAKDAVTAAGGIMQLVKNTRLGTAATRIYTTVQRAWNAVMALGSKAALGTRIQLAAMTVQQKVSAAAARISAAAHRGLAAMMNGTALAATRQRVATVATTVAQKAAAVAARAWAIAQRVLNAAMRANPIGLIITALTLLVGGLVLAYKKSDTFRRIVQAAWRGIQRAASFAWHKVILPVFRALNRFLHAVIFPVFRFLWKNVVQKYFALIRGYIKLWWAAAKLVFQALKLYFTKVLFPIFRFLWHRVVKPIFGWIGAKVRDIWRGWIRPAFGAIGRGVHAVGTAFGKAKDAIGKAWGKIKSLARKPVAFVINQVVRPLRNKLNAFTSKFGLNLPKVPKFRSGGPTANVPRNAFAGMVHGREYVTRAESRAKMERRHPGVLDHINRHGGLPGYRRGGPVGGRPGKTVWPMQGAVSRHSRADYPQAWDINSPQNGGAPVRAYKDGIIAYVRRLATSYGHHIVENLAGGGSAIYAHLSKILVRAGQVVKAGQMIGREGGTGNVTGPHLHFELRGTKASPFAGASASSGGSLPGWLSSLVSGPIKWLKNNLPMDKLAKIGNNPFVKMIGRIPKEIIKGAAGWVKDHLFNFDSNWNTKGSGDAAGYKGVVQQVLRDLGLPGRPDLVSAVIARINQESGGNPIAVNRDDANAAAGHPSVGLMQVIRGTYARYGPKGVKKWYGRVIEGVSTSPYNNIYAGLNYASSDPKYRHRSLKSVMLQSGGYDDGGILPKGLSLAYNGTNRPEHKAVFTDRQWQTMQQIADRQGRGGDEVNINLYGADLTPGDVAQAYTRAKLRLQRAGAY